MEQLTRKKRTKIIGKLNDEPKADRTEIKIDPNKIFRFLGVFVIILTAASFIGQIYKYDFGRDRYIVSLFDLDKEWNFPTWYSSATLLITSLLLLTIAFAKRAEKDEFVRQWSFLSLLFLLMSIDESVQLHEQTSTPIRALLGSGGIIYFAWVIPAAAFLLVLAVLYFKFIMNLPNKFKFWFILSGLVYVMGAVGMECIDSIFRSTHGENNLSYSFLTNFEELLEMTGVLLFIFTLLKYISAEFNNLTISFSEKLN